MISPPTKTKFIKLVCLVLLFVKYFLENTFNVVGRGECEVDDGWADFIDHDLHVLRWNVAANGNY